MSILVVGSVAFDTVETPFGRAEKVLGGSASFFSLAASFFETVNLVGVVGRDFGDAQLACFAGRDIDLEGLERVDGETFHWGGRYSDDLNSRETLFTHLNVFESFKPKIPEAYRDTDYVFLGNIDPVLQLEVLDQVRRPKLVVCDTMNFWIDGRLEALKQMLGRADLLLINDSEARQLSGESNLIKAARSIRTLGPATLVIKKGEHGAVTFSDAGSFAAPGFLVEDVVDPTGAGDTFAGGFLGYLASARSSDETALRRALIMGSTLASFSVEAFSVERLLNLTQEEIFERFRAFKQLVHFEPL
jgi:sugar/nucleoside kinase (ribokinase family)